MKTCRLLVFACFLIGAEAAQGSLRSIGTTDHSQVNNEDGLVDPQPHFVAGESASSVSQSQSQSQSQDEQDSSTSEEASRSKQFMKQILDLGRLISKRVAAPVQDNKAATAAPSAAASAVLQVCGFDVIRSCLPSGGLVKIVDSFHSSRAEPESAILFDSSGAEIAEGAIMAGLMDEVTSLSIVTSDCVDSVAVEINCIEANTFTQEAE
jgi:hypothetical protein